jgi:manganese/zinc/iron transport system permease protein
MFASASPGHSTEHLWAELWRVLTYQVPWMSNTAIVLRGTAILGLACGAVGTFLLLRKRSLVADALSHAALPGVCFGFLLAIWIGTAARWGVEPRSLLILIPGAAVFGLLGVRCVHLLSRVPRVKEDAAIGIVLSVFFALGVVLLSVIQRSGAGNVAGLHQFIFGQAATMTASDSNVIAIVSVLVLLAAGMAHKELKALCFDPQFARSIGWPASALDGLLLGMITALTVIGLSAVGAVLMVALLIIPPAAARFWTERLSIMILLSAFIGGVSCHIGTACSAVINRLPTGPAIVVACGGMFVISMLLAPRRGLLSAMLQRRALARQVARQHLLRAMYEHEEVISRNRASIDDLLLRRAWSAAHLRRILQREQRAGSVRRVNGGYSLTEAGRRDAARIVRTHRLWEHFLTTQADIAPSHVDRAADDIEHVLSDELVRELETELRAQGAVDRQAMPESAHALRPLTQTTPREGGGP